MIEPYLKIPDNKIVIFNLKHLVCLQELAKPSGITYGYLYLTNYQRTI
jgi:hypothetical protein